ncbi:unnamed protein product [Moneuplotes crassus]|uniref:Uncharacterized protein n=1 Tax=Euplotes crassus TaxID=5936 RepID=A0AAD1XFU2_EUPCR|nr:unnamed protein product [Moneuplotes crassus]
MEDNIDELENNFRLDPDSDSLEQAQAKFTDFKSNFEQLAKYTHQSSSDYGRSDSGNQKRICGLIEKELLDIVNLYSEDRKVKSKQIDKLKRDNKKLKALVADFKRNSSRRNANQSLEPDLVNRIVKQEVAKVNKQCLQEKDALSCSYSEELQRRDRHISILKESIHHQENEIKHLINVIGNSDHCQCKKIQHRDKKMKRRIRNMNKMFKDLDKVLHKKVEVEIENSEEELEDLMQVECRIRQHTPDCGTTQKETPNQTDASEPRGVFKGLITPYKAKGNHYRDYLDNKNLYKSNTEDNSAELLYGRKRIHEGIGRPHWSGMKQNASTSRISACQRLDCEKAEVLMDNGSRHLVQKYAHNEERNIRRSVNYLEEVQYYARHQDDRSSSNYLTFKERGTESRYQTDSRSSRPKVLTSNASHPVTPRITSYNTKPSHTNIEINCISFR